MSVPLKHHYVSRCLIDNFFNPDGNLFLYDKSGHYFTKTRSSKRIFYEEGLNSTVNKEGELNHSEIEEQLNKYFEQHFPIHYNKINAVISSKDDAQLIALAESGELEESVSYLLRMGVIGDMRTPYDKKKLQESLAPIFSIIKEIGNEKLKRELVEFQQLNSKVKYTTALDFNELADKIIQSMGEKVLTIYLASESDYFLLPDCSAGTWRAQLVPDTVLEDGTRYFNPSREIALVGMPINSKIFLRLESKQISREKKHTVQHLSSHLINHFNKWMYNAAHTRIACENESYLKEFVAKVSDSNFSNGHK